MIPRPGRLVLVGHPVAHSLSPIFQEAALREAGISLSYELLDVAPEALDRVLAGLTGQGAAGNVTVPYKSAVAHRCDRLMPAAERTGAVNTFWTEHGRLVGDNTDPEGFDDAVRELPGALADGADVAIVGAGGAAAGILAAIERWGDCRVSLYNRTEARARALADRFAPWVHVAPSAEAALGHAALVVNATSVGMAGDTLPFSLDALHSEAAIVDVVYRSGGTALVREARARHHPAVDGLPMLVGQGARSFERWFGRAPDRAVMWEALRSFV